MASDPEAIAIDIGRRKLRALYAARTRSKLIVKRVLVEPIPETLSIDDAAALGAWVDDCLIKAKFPKVKTTIAIPRERVGLKRLVIPTIVEDELPDMVRIALSRDLPFDADTAVIDYVIIESDEAHTTVLAVAVPQEVLDFQRQLADAAGISIDRISMRNMGSAALLESLYKSSLQGILAIDITGEGVEFSVVLDGTIRFARAAELPHLDDATGSANAVVTETRRTWMSYRIVEESNVVGRAVIFGDLDICDKTAGPVHELLSVTTEVLKNHPLVKCNAEDMDGVWPLAGLLLEPLLDVQTIDFAQPRKAPDIAARKRKRILTTVGAIAIVFFALWTMANVSLKNLQAQEQELSKERKTLYPDRLRFKRDVLKLKHARQWELANADWLEHLIQLSTVMPSPDQLVMDSWVGSLEFSKVQYDKKKKLWSTPHEVRIVVDGEARDQITVDAFRDALVQGKLYTLSSSGPDKAGGRRLDYKFTYRLGAEEIPESAKKNTEKVRQEPKNKAVAHRTSGDAGGNE
ncbi:MAG: pilus assembly protein PilM [Planctomycetes bacterium]|nr:pilus assembly protein PilM [Planctomycetota bacterium]